MQSKTALSSPPELDSYCIVPAEKDLDAGWTKKNEQSFYGFKNHVRSDAESVIITDYVVTDAAVDDSQVLGELIGADNEGESLFADSAYRSATTEAQLAWPDISSYIHEKAGRNKPLTTMQQEFNRLKSTVRCRIEQIFVGCVENSMGGPELEYLDLARISTGIGLSNLSYNLRRYAQLSRLGRVAVAASCAWARRKDHHAPDNQRLADGLRRGLLSTPRYKRPTYAELLLSLFRKQECSKCPKAHGFQGAPSRDRCES